MKFPEDIHPDKRSLQDKANMRQGRLQELHRGGYRQEVQAVDRIHRRVLYEYGRRREMEIHRRLFLMKEDCAEGYRNERRGSGNRQEQDERERESERYRA